jgi:hypothetical protein
VANYPVQVMGWPDYVGTARPNCLIADDIGRALCAQYYSDGLVPANTWVSLRFLIVGPDPGTQHGKIWAPADPEPSWVNAYTPQPLGATAMGNVQLRSSSAAPAFLTNAASFVFSAAMIVRLSIPAACHGS